MRDKSGESPLAITLDNIYNKKDFFDIANYLVKHGCHSDDVEVKLLCGACRWGDLKMVKELVGQLKINPNGELSYNYIKNVSRAIIYDFLNSSMETIILLLLH